MRIGLYGMPAAGKTYLLDRIHFLDVLSGSRLLREVDPDFDRQDAKGRERARRELAVRCRKRDNFIMDGHYAFGEETAFTEEDGELFDRFVYLYIKPELLKSRMEASDKDRKYAKYDLAAWQRAEIRGLREYCHRHDKDFYVIDCPPDFGSAEVETAVQFFRNLVKGYSCVDFARRIAASILSRAGSDTVTLLDGDKTLILEDSSHAVFDYRTHVFDGNFYTGYQSWMQYREFDSYEIDIPARIPVHRNPKLPEVFQGDVFLLSCGHKAVWEKIAGQFGIPVFAGREMSAETKFFVAKFLRGAHKNVIAYGDSMSDLFCLQEATEGYLVTRQDGSTSRSLQGRDFGGVHLV